MATSISNFTFSGKTDGRVVCSLVQRYNGDIIGVSWRCKVRVKNDIGYCESPVGGLVHTSVMYSQCYTELGCIVVPFCPENIFGILIFIDPGYLHSYWRTCPVFTELSSNEL
jgi:hypothetical protein